MIQVADRPETSTHHQEIAPPPQISTHNQIPPFSTLLLHDTKVDLWENLHDCYSVVILASSALSTEQDLKDSPSFAASVALQRVATSLMKAIETLDNLDFAK